MPPLAYFSSPVFMPHPGLSEPMDGVGVGRLLQFAVDVIVWCKIVGRIDGEAGYLLFLSIQK